MSLNACIPDLLADGKITPEQAAEAQSLFAEMREDFAARGAPETADALASDAVIAALEAKAIRRKFLAGRTIRTRQRIEADLGKWGDGRNGAGGGSGSGGGGGAGLGGPIDPRSGAGLIDHDPRAPYSNVEGRRKAVVGDAQRFMDSIMADHSANILGQVRNKAQLRDIVSELFGRSSGNPAAREMADAWRQTAEMLRRRFNAAGGDIGHRADWGLPQRHDWKKVRKAGFDAWRGDILPRLDRAKMIDRRTGMPFSNAALELQLRDTFENIRSNGATRMSPGSPGGRSLANARGEERFLIFKSADDWIGYADSFGSGTAYDAMVGHIEGMARDISALEILGPNPNGTIEWLKDTIVKSAALDKSPGSKAVSAARSGAKQIDRLWDEYNLRSMEADNETVALVFSGYRSFATATKLGSAFISGLSDFAFQYSRRAFNGLPQTRMIGDYLKLMKPGSIEDQKLAVRRGLIAEEWSSRTASQSRFLNQELTGEIPRRLAEGVLRLSLLSRHTQSNRWVYGMETLATYTEQAGKSMDQLDPAQGAALQRYGISAGDWDKLRSAKMDSDGGSGSAVEWISPHNLDDQDLASRFMEMVHEEIDIAVPVADLATRAKFSRLERGTVLGELGLSALQFKGFGISVVLRQMGEMQAMSLANAGRYAGGLLIGTTLMGALSLQLKALAAGKDPRPMVNLEFWGAAMLQGGGFGLFGDFLSSSENRFGGGLAQSVAGPLVSDVQDVANVVQSKEPKRDLLRVAKGMIPGNNLWYSKLAFDRLVADQLQEMADPDFRKSYARMDRFAREQGTEFFWRPGDPAPARAPDFSNALAEGPDQ